LRTDRDASVVDDVRKAVAFSVPFGNHLFKEQIEKGLNRVNWQMPRLRITAMDFRLLQALSTSLFVGEDRRDLTRHPPSKNKSDHSRAKTQRPLCAHNRLTIKLSPFR
jgi:hypothetical protein